MLALCRINTQFLNESVTEKQFISLQFKNNFIDDMHRTNPFKNATENKIPKPCESANSSNKKDLIHISG